MMDVRTEMDVRTHGCLTGIGDTLKRKYPRCGLRFGHIPEGPPFMEVDCGTPGGLEERGVVLNYEDEGAGFGVMWGVRDYQGRPDEVWLEPHEVVHSMSRWLETLR